MPPYFFPSCATLAAHFWGESKRGHELSCPYGAGEPKSRAEAGPLQLGEPLAFDPFWNQLVTSHFASDVTIPRGGCRGIRKACARAARRSLREKNLAWSQSQAIPQGSDRQASRLASRTGPPQHLGGDAPCRVLEVCRAAQDRRRQARLLRAEGQ